ncbi:unnamed protein product [Vitrella brassicaformis CCMP3155]|uniref:F-box domain-containing protein n=1 Tax=Vitrella brassicaformis (strain CCMP3155) TaxID=1169540 RepID=A0A0G4ES73_VITBC|nr:unnamed protein product [Vitrella brassicaformis CCMP3155]|eukprot:CEM00895.1 unnamed protein product [Vitrella brassicaformis CCMP3155]
MSLDETPEHVTLERVFTFFEPLDLCVLASVSRALRGLSERDSLWSVLCTSLWQGKAFVAERFRQTPSKASYRGSLADKHRDTITRGELCSLTWHFRFKRDAGEEWTDADPYWKRGSPMQWSFRTDGKMERADDHPELRANESEVRRWKFTRVSCGARGPKGRFVKVGRFPAYVVSRTANWGWLMESCWVVLYSFPISPYSQLPNEYRDEGLKVDTDLQWAEAFLYNNALNVPLRYLLQDGADSEYEPETEGRSAKRRGGARTRDSKRRKKSSPKANG